MLIVAHKNLSSYQVQYQGPVEFKLTFFYFALSLTNEEYSKTHLKDQYIMASVP